jgi:hypothetical protein
MKAEFEHIAAQSPERAKSAAGGDSVVQLIPKFTSGDAGELSTL